MLLYIDPGTGSMLFTIILGLLTTSVFFIRSVAIKLKFLMHGGRVRSNAESSSAEYIIYNEGKQYLTVFTPICDEFEKRCIPVTYWTSYKQDPLLSKGYKYIDCKYIGEGNYAFAKLNMMKAKTCLATTPGLGVYQWKRSPNVNNYVHILHSVGSAAGYRMFGLDFFDSVLLSGEFQISEIREIERKRGLTPKDLVIVGCTYLDYLRSRLLNNAKTAVKKTTVLLAPSWGSSSILCRFGKEIIDSLIRTEFQIIIRPHPQSIISDKGALDKLMDLYPDNEQLRWNFDSDNFDVLNESDIMISDFSGVMFDYALVFNKPIIYTEVSSFDSAPYDACWLDKPLWKYSVYSSFGRELNEADFPNLRTVIQDVINDKDLQSGRDKARDEAWQYIGEAATKTVDYLVALNRNSV